MDKNSATQTQRPVFTAADFLTPLEKRLKKQGLPLPPRPPMKELKVIAGTWDDESIMSNEEIESLGQHE